LGLQPALATAGYMSPSSTIDIERQDINTSDTSARPFDFSFDPDPPNNTSHHTTCPYTTIGADITIAHSGARISDFELSENAFLLSRPLPASISKSLNVRNTCDATSETTHQTIIYSLANKSSETF